MPLSLNGFASKTGNNRHPQPLCARMEEIECRLDIDPHFSIVLAGNVALMRNPRAALAKFGLSAHSRVAAQFNLLGSTSGPLSGSAGQKLQHSSQLWPGLMEVWYRLSGVDQFRSTEKVTKANQKAAQELPKLKRN